MTTDPIQYAVDALKYADHKIVVLAALCAEKSREPDVRIARLIINDALEQLRAHQSAQGRQPIETAPDTTKAVSVGTDTGGV